MQTNASLTMVPADALAAYVNGVVGIATAFLDKNKIEADQLPVLLRGIGAELGRAFNGEMDPVDLRGITAALSTADVIEEAAPEEIPDTTDAVVDRFAHLSRVPAVPIEQSVTYDAIVCLFDGVRKKNIKRWIRANYGMEEHEYRQFWNLPADYPMSCAGYLDQKTVIAVSQGLGTSRVTKVPKAQRELIAA